LGYGYLSMTPGGLPHSEIHGSKPADGSPWLIAAIHVLHRLVAPRHPPRALNSSAPRKRRAEPTGSSSIMSTQTMLLLTFTAPPTSTGWGPIRGLRTSEQLTVMGCSEPRSRFEATKKPIRSEAGSATRCPTEVRHPARLIPARRVDRIVHSSFRVRVPRSLAA